MRHRVAGRHLGRDTAHRLSLYRNLVTDLLRYERITTTEAKAKEIRPMAEKIITLARRGDVHARRQAGRFVFDPRVVKKTFDEIGPRMKDRPGGYLRITSLEPRKGDGARMAAIELVDYVEAPPTPRPQRVTAAPAVASGPAILDAPEAPVVPDVDGVPDEAEPEDTRDLMDRMIDKSDDTDAEVEVVDAEDEAPAAEAPETEIEAEAQQEAAEAEVEADAEAGQAADEEAAEAQEAPERPEGQAPA